MLDLNRWQEVFRVIDIVALKPGAFMLIWALHFVELKNVGQ